MKAINAIYREPILPEHKGNPLIEALPPKINKSELIEELSFYPIYDSEIRKKDDFIREEYLSRIDTLRQPLPEYIECFRLIESALKESYSSKNPFSPSTQNYLHYLKPSDSYIIPHTGPFAPKGSAISLIGESGIGKSKMLTQILHYFPQVVIHKSYKEKDLRLKQLIWIKIECPHDASLRGLCHAILGEIDRALEVEDTTPERNIDTLLDQIERKVRSSFVGIIVIDEMQNLNIGKAGGAQKLLSFLLNLINRSGVPVLFCGNPDVAETFSDTFRNARRAESGGYISMDRLSPEVWSIFCEELWILQWTNIETPLNNQLSERLYMLSCGIIDIAIRIYKKAQELVIGSSNELITLEVLDMAYPIACPLTENELSKIRRNDQTKKSLLSILKKVADETPVTNEVDSRNKTIAGDLTRPQHPEFSKKLTDLQNAVNLHDRISDPDVFQRASEDDSPTEYLKKLGILCDDPLTMFS